MPILCWHNESGGLTLATQPSLCLTLALIILAGSLAGHANANDTRGARYNSIANEPDEIQAAMPEGKPELSTREIATALQKAEGGEPVDLSSKSLRYLDAAGLNLTRAKFANSDLWGIDLSESDLSGVDLSNTRLNRASITRANFARANLEGATLLRPTVHTTFQYDTRDAPSFADANMKAMRIMGKLDGTSFRGADLTSADFSGYEARPGMGTLTTRAGSDLLSCDFSGGTLDGANFTKANLSYSRFAGAELRGARFIEADLSKVDFSGADLTGADFTDADIYGAVFTGAKGLDHARGLRTATNYDKATF